jgi:RNA polymerase sigma-70 factor (ECF subfamily)
MLGIAASIVGPADAEDALQEAIVRAWQAWPKLRDRAVFSAWMARVTVNVCRDWQRGRFGTRRRLNEPLPDEDATGAPLALIGNGPGGSDHAAALDLRHALGEIESDLRLVVALRYYAGLDATEIGEALGIPPATVRTRLRRALQLLRQRLDEMSSPRHSRHETNQEEARDV